MRKEYKRTLIKFSNYSLCVTLPKAMLRRLELDKGDEVMITLKRGKLIIEPVGNNASSKKGKDAWKPLPDLSKE